MQAKSCSEDRAQKLCVRRKPDTDSASDCNCAGMGNVRAWKLCGHIWLGIVRAAKMCLHNSPARTISSQNVPAHFACSHNSLSAQFPAKMCLHNSPARTIPMPAQFPAKMCPHTSPARTIPMPAQCALPKCACSIRLLAQFMRVQFPCSHIARGESAVGSDVTRGGWHFCLTQHNW